MPLDAAGDGGVGGNNAWVELVEFKRVVSSATWPWLTIQWRYFIASDKWGSFPKARPVCSTPPSGHVCSDGHVRAPNLPFLGRVKTAELKLASENWSKQEFPYLFSLGKSARFSVGLAMTSG